MSYYITSFCYDKYLTIENKWRERISNMCKNCMIEVYKNINTQINYGYAWWDIVRLHNNLNLLIEKQIPIVQVDMDIIIEKDIEPLVNLDYDFIISTEIGGNKAFPPECSSILGFGVCSGFYVAKPSALSFLVKMLSYMKTNKYKSNSDQVTIMNYIVSNEHQVTTETVCFDNITYTNHIIHIDNIKICVLDFNIIIRDPIFNNGQFGNHINIDNVGGVNHFLKYYDESLENLPLTCRCGKTHLGDTSICKHIEMRKNNGTHHS